MYRKLCDIIVLELFLNSTHLHKLTSIYSAVGHRASISFDSFCQRNPKKNCRNLSSRCLSPDCLARSPVDPRISFTRPNSTIYYRLIVFIKPKPFFCREEKLTCKRQKSMNIYFHSKYLFDNSKKIQFGFIFAYPTVHRIFCIHIFYIQSST